ncbi:MAG: hypothetical protein JSU92_09570 [Deltaproteobacteria bacterium]|nr:MAG: hypothetical protein JSU92_09570 [Deltaproteobacteria bacterium]
MSSGLDLILRIREAETEAEKIIERARVEASHSLRAGEEQVKKIVYDAHSRSEEIIRNAEDNARDEAEQEITRMKKTTQAELKKLKEKAGTNMDRAVDYIIERILA